MGNVTAFAYNCCCESPEDSMKNVIYLNNNKIESLKAKAQYTSLKMNKIINENNTNNKAINELSIDSLNKELAILTHNIKQLSLLNNVCKKILCNIERRAHETELKSQINFVNSIWNKYNNEDLNVELNNFKDEIEEENLLYDVEENGGAANDELQNEFKTMADLEKKHTLRILESGKLIAPKNNIEINQKLNEDDDDDIENKFDSNLDH